jgi:AcrR family transcriptional regulator
MGEPAERGAKDARRRQILDAAFTEFATKGYAGTSMEAIARRANASKETLYAWFDNKQALFNTLMDISIEGVTSRVSAAYERDPAPAHVLKVIAEDVLRQMLAIAPLVQAMGSGEQGREALRPLGVTITEWRGHFVDYMLQAREKGEIAFDDDPFELVSVFVAMAQGEWSLRLATGMTDKVTEQMIAAHAERVTRIFLQALAPPGTF